MYEKLTAAILALPECSYDQLDLVKHINASPLLFAPKAQRELLRFLTSGLPIGQDLSRIILDALFESVPTIHDIRTAYGLTQAALAEKFGIPKRTIENWDEGSRKPPEYVVRMMLRILELEK